MGSRKQQQLGDLLQQEQEPFALELYLFERGYFRENRSKLESSSSRPVGCCINGNNYVSRIFRTLLNKLTRSNTRNNNCDRRKREAKFTRVNENIIINNNNKYSINSTKDSAQVASEVERESFCSDDTSVTTVFNSPASLDQHYDSLVPHTLDGLNLSNLTEQECYEGRDFECEFMPKYNQLSPNSVLEQSNQPKVVIRTSEGKESQTTCMVQLPSKLVVEDSTKLSGSICKLNFEPISANSIRNNGEITDEDDDDPIRVFESDGSPPQQFAKPRRIMLQQTKQLLFDCVREVISERVDKCHKELFGQDELGNLLLERMKAWDEIELGNDSKTIALSTFSDLDSLDCCNREWKIGTNLENREICFEIGDSIAYDFIDDIVGEFQQ